MDSPVFLRLLSIVISSVAIGFGACLQSAMALSKQCPFGGDRYAGDGDDVLHYKIDEFFGHVELFFDGFAGQPGDHFFGGGGFA